MLLLVGETAWVPDVVLVPLQEPVAVQDAALVVLQVRVELLPLVMLVGLALMVTVGLLALVVTLRAGVVLALSLPALS